MFTGIVETQGKVVYRGRSILKLVPIRPLKAVVLGESIAVDGVCLTVEAIDGPVLQFRLLGETVRVSALGRLAVGSRVNLERSLKVSDRVGGHLILGHVDAKGMLKRRTRKGSSQTLTIQVPRGMSRWMVPKGPISVDGVSLTLDPAVPDTEQVPANGFDIRVHLVPHTAKVTTLGAKPIGAELNLEADLVAKYLARQVV